MNEGYSFADINYTVDYVILFIGCAYAFYRYRQKDRSLRLICMLLWVSALSELLAEFFAIKFRNNLPVYNIYNLTEFVIINLYFNYGSPTLKRHNIGWILGAIGILAGITNMVLLQPLHTINSNFLFFEYMEIIVIALYCLYRMLIYIETSLFKEMHFWIICILLFYECNSLWLNGTLNYAYERIGNKAIFLIDCFTIANSLTYTGFIAIFYFYPKLRKTYV